jgi:hypothetical protein
MVRFPHSLSPLTDARKVGQIFGKTSSLPHAKPIAKKLE